MEVTGKEDVYKMYGLDDVAVGGPAGSRARAEEEKKGSCGGGCKLVQDHTGLPGQG